MIGVLNAFLCFACDERINDCVEDDLPVKVDKCRVCRRNSVDDGITLIPFMNTIPWQYECWECWCEANLDDDELAMERERTLVYGIV